MKIALLLLTIDNPLFPNNLYEHINEKVKLYIHAKNKIDNFYKKYLIKNIIPTKWGDFSLIDATINLLESSYNECDYFYLISGDSYIMKEPEIYDYSCFEVFKEYYFEKEREFKIFKTSQWFGLNKKDAEIIIKTRKKYKDFFLKNLNPVKNGAYDENYILSVLNKENINYNYMIKKVMYVKWLSNVITKHPIIFNKMTESDKYLSRNSLFIRKCLESFEITESKKRDVLYIFYIGTITLQEDILKLDLKNIDYAVITSIEIKDIKEEILKNTYYVIPIIWKFYKETKESLGKDIMISVWNKVIFYEEKTKYILYK